MSLDFIHKVRFKRDETNCILSLRTLAPGTYQVKIDMMGDALLSTLYVKSMDVGASVEVEYFDFTLGGDFGEENPLRSHPLLTAPGNHRQLVTAVHNKPVARIIVTGGDVEMSLYGTMSSATLGESDANLVIEGQVVNLPLDKARVMAGWDEVTGVWRVARIDKFGNLCTKAGAGSTIQLSDAGKHAGDKVTEQSVVTIPLQNSLVYEEVCWLATCFRDTQFRVIHNDNGVEIEKGIILVGPTHYTDANKLGIKFTSGAVGTQELLLKALNLDKISQMSGSLAITENQP